jgi:hypothetical protein
VADRFVGPSNSAASPDCFENTASEGCVKTVSKEYGNSRAENQYEEIARAA